MQGAAPNMLPQQQQREAMDVLQRLAALSGASRPESWAQLAAMTSVGANSNVQLPPLSSSLMGHSPFGSDSAVSQALLQHYWANYLQQQQQQGLPRGGSGPLAPDALLAALQAQQQQQPQADGLNLPAFQQGLAALLSPSQQQTSVPPHSGVSQPSDALPSSSAAARQKRNLEQLVQAAEEAGEVREARSETSGSCSSPDSKDNGEVKKGSRKRKETRILVPEPPAAKETTLLVSEDMMAFDNDEGGSGRLQVPLYKNAKEKNRQAQRRFRERQKGLINALKDRAHSLDKRVEEQAQAIHTLKEENNMLKLLLAEKAYAPQLMQPPQLQQPALPHSNSAQKLHGLEQSNSQPVGPTVPEAAKK